ncbi:MAG: glutamine-hydrolyzing carbamoyl-phosphate synthase small subunit [Planctomycetales bacterium]|nr:glutamine-hydrolyzing carbamoyl-phosphate synthase small subunit [Planctomycetales bacterium]MBN8628902.1 glutamine-hydrolyzing carbamoyl-phosphate synthase small subunit [Planctomycetota bacterium]
MPQAAKLALEDGTVFTGTSIGAEGEVDGEVCFNTSMTGYQEILTDPSYRGQIVTMTYPQIGNYGVNAEDLESPKPHLAGFVVRELSGRVSNFRAEGDLSEYLRRYNIPGIQGIDTRALVRKLRMTGAMKGVLSTVDLDDRSLVAKAKASPGLVGRDLVREVMPDQPREWSENLSPWMKLETTQASADDAGKPHVVALDYGMKWNIPRYLRDRGFRVSILPGTAKASDVLAANPDGVFLSNGPGDPEPLNYAIETIRGVLGKKPVFGICLGHQLLSLACGAGTFKLKFGHRGANQPVMNYETGVVEITSQNHGFAVDEASLPSDLEVTHRNLNDNTIEGVRHKKLPAFCVQYHPEASAGPHDSSYLFDKFRELIGK